MKDRPLASLCVMFHNQVAYARATLESAFAQTYEPLEIVISDDASTDGTSELLCEMVAAYRKRGGQHTVIYHRNEQNLGMLGNRHCVFSLANGELLVNADGDDIALPNKVEVLVTAWLIAKKEPMLIRGEGICIDLKDRFVGATDCCGKRMGAVLAVCASAMRLYPSVLRDAAFHAHDDVVVANRATMLGPVLWIDEYLFLYRMGSGLSSGGGYRRKMVRGFTGLIAAAAQMSVDLNCVRDRMSTEAIKEVERRINEYSRMSEKALKLWNGNNFRERIRGYRQYAITCTGAKMGLICILLLLPRRSGDFVLSILDLLHQMLLRIRMRRVCVTSYSPYVAIDRGKVVVRSRHNLVC